MAIKRKEEEIMELSSRDDCSGAEDLDKAEVELEELLDEEEYYWRARSREVWLENGDRNTKWFHTKASHRRKKNKIEGIYDQNGE